MRIRLRVYGIVQGVGFRPFVARIAKEGGIAGSVCNKGPFVEIYAQGAEAKVNEFALRLTNDAPERSAILKVEKEELPDTGESTFSIIESEKVSGEVFVSPDIATCPKCRAELFDKHNRRYLHPFINCTACGPRLTILDSMPYDRVRTSMKDFPMCARCEREYTSPDTRRYHAQPVCCNECGPRLVVIHPAGMKGLGNGEAIAKVRDVLRQGGIAAVKGIGGFHLCCDAANDEAVKRLRRLKARATKPFALMMRDMDAVRRECAVNKAQEAILTGHNKPILLVKKRYSSAAVLSPAAAPHNPRVGVMLPYAPVQMLLFDYPDEKPFTDVLVMTSGNPRGAPICRTDEDALQSLRAMCDIILSNGRVIRLRADDSVMAWDDGLDAPVMIRRSRGYAPLPVMLDTPASKAVLAIGGELKNTFCLSKGNLYYLSPYIGDMADVRSVEALHQAVKRMEHLLEIKPSLAVCDKHPLYNTAAVARSIAEESGIALLQVQHHHAHVASCMAENGWKASRGPVIGVAFDGTGYGDDGSIWGGEILIADYASCTRAASIEPFMQAGGDLSSRQGWRIAISLLDEETVRALHIASEEEISAVKFMLEQKVNTVKSTSCGRLFDAVSAILGFCRESSFEGEAAMRVQAQAEAFQETNKDPIPSLRDTQAADLPSLRGGAPGEAISLLPATRLMQEIAMRKLRGEDAALLAYHFHDALSCMVASACAKCREKYGIETAALTGGVFNNTLLRSLCRNKLMALGFDVLVHTLVPAGDGGIALGQAAIAKAHNN